ncbi:MAG: hypothetical protein U0736_21830 [Gemmataceae bacterium]
MGRSASISSAPAAASRRRSPSSVAAGTVTATCRPNSASNGDGSNPATSTRCISCPGPTSSQAAGRPTFAGRSIDRQPRAAVKKAADRATSRVASVKWAIGIDSFTRIGI